MGFVNSSNLAVILLLLPAAFAQSTVILTVAPPQKVAAKRNTDVTAKIEVSIAAGYHINSNTPHEAYLIPLRLTWTPAPLEVETVSFPKPRDEKYSFSEQPISVFTGNFEIATKFKVRMILYSSKWMSGQRSLPLWYVRRAAFSIGSPTFQRKIS